MTVPGTALAWAHAAVGTASGAVTGLVTQEPAPPPGDPAAGRGEEFGKTSPLALVVIILLALATILLIRSMNKRLRNVPASFDTPDGAPPDGTGGDPAGTPPVDAGPEAGAQGADGSATGTRQMGRSQGPPGTGSP